MFEALKNNRIVVIALILIALSILILPLLFSGGKQPTTPSSRVPQSADNGIYYKPNKNALYGYLKTSIGETTPNLDKLPSFKEKYQIDQNSESYSYQSPRALRDDTIVTQNQQVVFESKVGMLENGKLPDIAEYIRLYGPAEAIVEGSYYYGDVEKTYIWATRGFALITDGFGQGIDEFQTFVPMSVEEYRTRWGKDIYAQPSQIKDP